MLTEIVTEIVSVLCGQHLRPKLVKFMASTVKFLLIQVYLVYVEL